MTDSAVKEGATFRVRDSKQTKPISEIKSQLQLVRSQIEKQPLSTRVNLSGRFRTN